MSERGDRHRGAAERHAEAAERHASAAAFWDEQGDTELAELERRNSRIELDAAQLERDRAELFDRRGE